MPTTVRRFSARAFATSSPPTPMPRTMTSTRSVMSSSRAYPPALQRIGDRLLEAHCLPLCQHPGGFVVVEPLPAGAAFLFTEHASQARTTAFLECTCRPPQAGRAPEIAIVARQRGEVVELEHDPRNIPRSGEELDGFHP